jgi:hypothetical protein
MTLPTAADVIATITAECARCDWATHGREAVLLELHVDDAYSQHVVLTRSQRASYRVMLGRRSAGAHRLSIRRDDRRWAPDSGDATIGTVDIEAVSEESEGYQWLSRAPFLRARPGSIERFSDVPLVTYVEKNVMAGEGGASYRYQYTTIFSNEDGGTPADRLMATWGRTTDIEFVFGITDNGAERIQAEGHRWIDFRGPRLSGHPELWVATDNNMVADHGRDDAIRFAPLPRLVSLDDTSREKVMDDESWTYAVAAAEARREGRIDPNARAGSGTIVDPRRYATVEACAEVENAAIAMDVGVRRANDSVEWYASDQDDPKFRIVRGGCFRGSAPLPESVSAHEIVAVRFRAYSREASTGAPGPAASRVIVRRLYRVFMLDTGFALVAVDGLRWEGERPVDSGQPVTISRTPAQ